MRHSKILKIGLILIGSVLLVVLLYQVPAVHSHLAWRLDLAEVYARGIIYPANDMPTPIPVTPEPLGTATPTPVQPTATLAATQAPTATPEPTPTLPPNVSFPSPAYEKQEMNNCGPATLTMYLRMYSWKGTQKDIASQVKPIPDDRNVNVDELVNYVNQNVTYLHMIYRVGGTVDLLKRFLANGFPVMIEESMMMDETYWPNDDRWAGHYLLLTGYDDSKQSFISQDAFYGSDRDITYQQLNQNWQSFNRVYLLVYVPEQEDAVKNIIGADWDEDTSRQHALDTAQAETKSDPSNPFAWFNLGTNQVYFERYAEAAQSYDKARENEMPQRMLRYQFGPFIAYFNSGRLDDLQAIVEYALKRTPNSEETLLWQGWLLYRRGDTEGARASFQKALEVHPDYPDALYAINFLNGN
jgi:tetratricopeptide (TPR) repeat protein